MTELNINNISICKDIMFTYTENIINIYNVGKCKEGERELVVPVLIKTIKARFQVLNVCGDEKMIFVVTSNSTRYFIHKWINSECEKIYDKCKYQTDNEVENFVYESFYYVTFFENHQNILYKYNIEEKTSTVTIDDFGSVGIFNQKNQAS